MKNINTQKSSDKNQIKSESGLDMDMIVKTVTDMLGEKAEREVPENGKYTPVSVSFLLPGTNNDVRFLIEHDSIDPQNSRRLSIGVRHKNSDRLTSNCMKKGTKKEILDYLKDEKNHKAMQDAVLHLSKKTDEYYNG